MKAGHSSETLLPAMPGDLEASSPPDGEDHSESQSKQLEDKTMPSIELKVESETSQADNDAKPSESTKSPDELANAAQEAAIEEGWAFWLDCSQKYDKKQLETWTDELASLLVFAGLFSAVVTAYTIESYRLLQPDPSDMTNQLLQQISWQLQAFSVTPPLINSTYQAHNVTATAPTSTAVTVNMLWFLSLTFSLMAAFFAIAAQQWIRALPLPQHLSVHNTVYLQQRRRYAFVACQVPRIIPLLPVLLQLAVVLFLTGMYHFLNALNQRITTAVTVVAGIPFALYGISLFLPLLWPTCPFKSPLVPSLIFILHWVFITVTILGLLLVVIPAIALNFILTYGVSCCGRLGAATAKVADRALFSFFEKLREVLVFIRWLILAVVSSKAINFWAGEEIRRCPPEETWDYSVPLSWAPNAVPNHQLIRLRPCLLQCTLRQRITCVLNWVDLHYRGKFNRILEYRSLRNQWDDWTPVHLGVLCEVNQAFAIQFKTFLLDALPTEKELREDKWTLRHHELNGILILLTQIAKKGLAEPDLRQTITHIVVRLIREQDLMVLKHTDYDDARFPAVCLYECTGDGQYKFSLDETTALIELLDRHFCTFSSLQAWGLRNLQGRWEVNTVEMTLALAATTFVALQQHIQSLRCNVADGTIFSRTVCRVLESFRKYVKSERSNIQMLGKAAFKRPEQPLIVTRRAAKTIADALWGLVSSDCLGSSVMNQASLLVRQLTKACSDRDIFGDTIYTLSLVSALCPEPVAGLAEEPIDLTLLPIIVIADSESDSIPNVHAAESASGMVEGSCNVLNSDICVYGSLEKDVAATPQDELLSTTLVAVSRNLG